MRLSVLGLASICALATPAAAQQAPITKAPRTPIAPVIPAKPFKAPLPLTTVSGMTPTSGIWGTKVTLTGANLDKVTGAKVIWYPNDVETGTPQGPITSMYTVKSATSAEAYIPVSSGGGASAPVVRLMLTGPFGEVLAGKFTVDRTMRVDQYAVKHQNLYQIKDWGEPGDRLDIVGVNLEHTTSVDFVGGPMGTMVGASFNLIQFIIPSACNGVAKWILHGAAQNDYVTPKPFNCWMRPKVAQIVPSSLPWGETFTINGENLAQVTKVSGNGGFSVNVTCTAILCSVKLPKIAWTTPVSGPLMLEGGKELVTTAQSLTITPSP
jgi:hypothetical protein